MIRMLLLNAGQVVSLKIFICFSTRRARNNIACVLQRLSYVQYEPSGVSFKNNDVFVEFGQCFQKLFVSAEPKKGS